jgi:hypothetical protein
MHAVVVRVTVNDEQDAQEGLESRIVPGVSQSPGFVCGYWTRAGGTGLSMVVFESEDAARNAADRVPQMVTESVTLEEVEVRQVVANA